MESSTYSQVVFTDIPQSYPTNTPVTCHYTVTPGLQPNPRDWVGICKVGWSSTRDYHTFVWVEPSLDVVGEEPVKKEVLFREYYLPKDEAEFYQFCYVDSSGQVRGVSNPFSFKPPGQLSVDCSLENDLLVITTQDQVEQSEQEKADLVKDLEQMREQNKSMRSELEERDRDIKCLQAAKDQLTQRVSELEEHQQQSSRENQELNQSIKSMAEPHEPSLNPIQEKYDRAVIKINQLKKERDELKMETEEQHVQISQLKKLEGDLDRLRDCIQLLQVDLQTSEKEKEKLQAELRDLTPDLDGLKRENQGLRRSLSEREALQEMADSDSNVSQQALVAQLQGARQQLLQEIQVSKDARFRAERAEREHEDAMARLEGADAMLNEQTQKIGKLEMQLTELYSEMGEKGNKTGIAEKEKHELTRENLELRGLVERLRIELSDLQTAPSPAVPAMSLQHSNPYGRSANPHTTQEEHEERSCSLNFGNPYDNIEIAADQEEEAFEELSLECRHCREKFPGITQAELEQHEGCHKVCPFCTLLCDGMEQTVFEDHVYGHEV